MKKNKLILFCIALLLITQQANAGFPIGKGRWLLVPTFNHYVASSYWDDNRTLHSFDKSGRFVSNYLGVYGGYGINRDLEFIFKVPFISNTYTDTTLIEPNSGIGDVNIGLCYYLSHYDYFRHLSLTGTLIIPFYSNQTDVYKHTLLGYGAMGIEAKLGYAGTNQKVLKKTFYDLEVGVRQYFATEGPTQLFTNLTFGVPIDESWKACATLRGVTSSSPYGNISSNFVASTVNREYDYLRFELAAGVKATRSTSIWLSVYTDILGKHIGKGSGYSIFAVIKF